MARTDLFGKVQQIKRALTDIKTTQPTRQDTWKLYRYEVEIPIAEDYTQIETYQVRFLQEPINTPWFRGYSFISADDTYTSGGVIQTILIRQFQEDVSNTIGGLGNTWLQNSVSFSNTGGHSYRNVSKKFIVYSAHPGQLIITKLDGSSVES